MTDHIFRDPRAGIESPALAARAGAVAPTRAESAPDRPNDVYKPEFVAVVFWRS